MQYNQFSEIKAEKCVQFGKKQHLNALIMSTEIKVEIWLEKENGAYKEMQWTFPTKQTTDKQGVRNTHRSSHADCRSFNLLSSQSNRND